MAWSMSEITYMLHIRYFLCWHIVVIVPAHYEFISYNNTYIWIINYISFCILIFFNKIELVGIKVLHLVTLFKIC